MNHHFDKREKSLKAAGVEVKRDGKHQSFTCAARAQGTAGGNDPADCNWPVCGCDPYADKVIDALREAGMIAVIRNA